MLLIEGSLAVVDDADVPTMVSALLQLITATNAVKILRSIRTEAAHVTIPIATLLASPLVASIRARPPCARAYIAELSRTAPLTSMDILAVASLLQVPSMRRAAAGALFAAIRLYPPAIDTLRATLSSHVGNDPANIHLVYVTLQQSLSPPPSVGSSRRRRGAALWQQLEPSLLLSTSVAVSEALVRHHAPLRKQAVNALLTACATRSTGHTSAAARSTCLDADGALEHMHAGIGKSVGGGLSGRSGGAEKTVECAQIAACTLLQIAEVDAACLQDCSELLCQFFAQHAAICDHDILHLISATISRIIAHQLAQAHVNTRGGGGSSSYSKRGWDPRAEEDDDENGGLGMLGTYSGALLLIQKLFFSIRPELLKSALILSGHVLRDVRVPQGDAEMMLRNALRLPFDPSWLSARWTTRHAPILSKEPCTRLKEPYIHSQKNIYIPSKERYIHSKKWTTRYVHSCRLRFGDLRRCLCVHVSVMQTSCALRLSPTLAGKSALRLAVLLNSKEPCMHSTNPCIHSQEAYIRSKNSWIPLKEPYVSSKEP